MWLDLVKLCRNVLLKGYLNWFYIMLFTLDLFVWVFSFFGGDIWCI